MSEIETARDVFKTELRRKAKKKRADRKAALAKAKVIPLPEKPAPEPVVPEVLTEIRDSLSKLLDRAGKPGSVEFDVIKRDWRGKVKRFKVIQS